MREQLKVETTSEPRQYAINNLPIELGTRDWNDVYVSFSGYFGSHGPQVFAAAPEQHELLKTFTEWARQVAARTDVPRGIRSAAANLHDDGKRMLAKATGTQA